jgi:hypothetical protein
MFAMQYEVTLPADYDMKVIRHRVMTKGPALDTLPGLGVKAYLIREKGVLDSPVNQYAPFYLWATVDGMNNFLWGGGFSGFREAFGRPSVQHWTGVAFARGPAAATGPRAATRQIVGIPADADPAETVGQAVHELQERALVPGVHSTGLAVDVCDWELVHFTLWEESPGDDSYGVRYEVLHLSTPHLGDLKTGRYW